VSSHRPTLSFAVQIATVGGALWLVSLADGRLRLGPYGVVVFTILGLKLVGASLHRPATTPAWQAPRLRVTMVVPIYNEDPDLLRACLRSVLLQRRPPDRLHLVDDGSSNPTALAAAEELLPQLRERMEVEATRAPHGGKREALALGFAADPSADVYLTVDSDTVLDADAIAEGVRPFADPQVAAVSGMVLASNNRRNLLTRLIDIRYANAFLYERAAYSTLGSVLCACGALAFYRGEVVRAHLEDFVNQRFLGVPAVFGDDRRLTNYALRHGRVVLQESATGHTAVPERLGHFLRQQVRWNKSFFRESLHVVKTFPTRNLAFWITTVELVTWLAFTLALLSLLVPSVGHTNLLTLAIYLAHVSLMAYARSVRYLDIHRSGQRLVGRLGVFALAPLYGLLHLVLLLPLRLWSLATLGSGAWGTRNTVEVTATAPG
jgi:hyaluronan synthase